MNLIPLRRLSHSPGHCLGLKIFGPNSGRDTKIWTRARTMAEAGTETEVVRMDAGYTYNSLILRVPSSAEIF